MLISLLKLFINGWKVCLLYMWRGLITGLWNSFCLLVNCVVFFFRSVFTLFLNLHLRQTWFLQSCSTFNGILCFVFCFVNRSTLFQSLPNPMPSLRVSWPSSRSKSPASWSATVSRSTSSPPTTRPLPRSTPPWTYVYFYFVFKVYKVCSQRVVINLMARGVFVGCAVSVMWSRSSTSTICVHSGCQEATWEGVCVFFRAVQSARSSDGRKHTLWERPQVATDTWPRARWPSRVTEVEYLSLVLLLLTDVCVCKLMFKRINGAT